MLLTIEKHGRIISFLMHLVCSLVHSYKNVGDRIVTSQRLTSTSKHPQHFDNRIGTYKNPVFVNSSLNKFYMLQLVIVK